VFFCINIESAEKKHDKNDILILQLQEREKRKSFFFSPTVCFPQQRCLNHFLSFFKRLSTRRSDLQRQSIFLNKKSKWPRGTTVWDKKILYCFSFFLFWKFVARASNKFLCCFSTSVVLFFSLDTFSFSTHPWKEKKKRWTKVYLKSLKINSNIFVFLKKTKNGKSTFVCFQKIVFSILRAKNTPEFPCLKRKKKQYKKKVKEKKSNFGLHTENKQFVKVIEKNFFFCPLFVYV